MPASRYPRLQPRTFVPITTKSRDRFTRLISAASAQQLCLTACKDIRTGKPADVICIAQEINGTHAFIPIARLFRGDPYNEVTLPGHDAPKMI